MARTMEWEGKQEEDAYPERARGYSDASMHQEDVAERGPLVDGDNHAIPAENGAVEEEKREETDATSGRLELALRDERVRTLVGLELPVYGSRMERVLETVGGLKTLQETHEAKSQFLPVKLRPTEPSCKPLFADLTKTQTILLRVRRKKVSKNAEASTEASKAYAFEGQVVGLVREKYVCEGMADFQYFTARKFYPETNTEVMQTATATKLSADYGPSPLPVGAAMPLTAVSTYTGSDRQLALRARLRPYVNVQDEQDMEMLPEVFSKVDLPLKYEFRQRSGYQPTESAKKPSSTMTYLNFHEDTPAPAAPKPDQPVLRRRPVGANDCIDDDVLRILQEKLVEKPIWLRPKLFAGLDFVERRAARRIVRKLCYVFVDGPWRGSWIRMGYDPRKTNDSAKYQVIELRNNRELVHAKVTHASRKRTKKFSGINPKGPRIVKVTQTSENENAQASKRRRKERFQRGETRRTYLVDPNEAPLSPEHSVMSMTSAGTERFADWDSDNEGEPTEGDSLDTNFTETTGQEKPAGEKTYEIFGVPLTSANVLFQLDEIDDDDVKEWVSQFQFMDTPTLLGGWYSTHMFLPLREIIRNRIAALVGRSQADLETRRKRIDALKKQALSDYADQLAGREPSNSKKAREKRRKAKEAAANGHAEEKDDAEVDTAPVETMEEDDSVEALEASLARKRTEQDTESLSKRVPGDDEDDAEGSIDEDDEEEEEEDPEEDEADEVAAQGRLRPTDDVHSAEEDEEESGDDDVQEPTQATSTPSTTTSVEYSF
ncbi:hypothetical protein Poli38472_007953 [Pythium oligandrum]|uniref:Uncharacterized protein n=1 Tax=Pythium oligandrum TaxID=41045 RepID=A0A8K1FJU6_PYTOL|nr:hypothetical protein Poli38472_007953 [Pythium oligandrum]|eukprot:TMW65311.1 hypothetical protein Poli38472_007953 [Pythium oligandrum]